MYTAFCSEEIFRNLTRLTLRVDCVHRRERSRSPSRRAAMRVKKALSQEPATDYNRARRIFLSFFLSSCLHFVISPRDFHESSSTITKLRHECARTARPDEISKFNYYRSPPPLSEPSREKCYNHRRWTMKMYRGNSLENSRKSKK